MHPKMISSCGSIDLQGLVVQHLSECLTQILKEPVPMADLSPQLKPDLCLRLMSLLVAARTSSATNSTQLVTCLLESLLEASLFSKDFWKAFVGHEGVHQLVNDLILQDSRVGLRKSCVKLIGQKCSFTPSVCSLTSLDYAAFFWGILDRLISNVTSQPAHGEEMLGLALNVFRKVMDSDGDGLPLQHYLRRWSRLLAIFQSQEELGNPERIDVASRGIASLIYWCASYSKVSTQPIAYQETATLLFDNCLFPEVTELDTRSTTLKSELVPILDVGTRKLLYDAILIITRDDKSQFKTILRSIQDLVPYDASEEWPYINDDMPWNFDRSRAIRSVTGYVGLRNLSNTCYLNSLLTQLFMNIGFREFMLNSNVAEARSAQKLLFETQRLFSHMQNSLKRFIDPADFALAIRTYEDTTIDISVQMDVDEFYNLLFDRWEGQVLTPSDKQKFRSFYGGQLVQQVKSKECPHISERLEPFAAIQCDIKGKSTLQESLQAYVDGEIMEGDNKYKCSSCDKHVNAVKRACLKDVPNNMIFHLKRFDYNLRTMQRSKINDHFSFPHTLDMRPYKVEYLTEMNNTEEEDIFELVGILVHSGTAESGHYYSYIRERPSSTNSWVEFNDDTVTPFDPSLIEATCFGGTDCNINDNGNFPYDKSWSAYMLFYERASTLRKQENFMTESTRHSPVAVKAPVMFHNYLVVENEALMRRYCLYDDNHSKFVLKMMNNLDNLNRGRCSEDHSLEKAVLGVVLDHLDQVVARKRDQPDLSMYVSSLSSRFEKCGECSRDFLDWMIDHSEGVRILLFRSPEQTVRSELGHIIVVALASVKQNAAYAYGTIADLDGSDDTSIDQPRLFPKIAQIVTEYWEHFHLHTRAWPEYFSLLTKMARMGLSEAAILIDYKLLRNVLECLRADSGLPISPQYTRMLNIITKRNISKPVAWGSVIELLEALMSFCDLSMRPIDDSDDERFDLVDENARLPITSFERHLMVQIWNQGKINILANRLFYLGQNEEATQRITTMMLRDLPEARHGIVQAIRGGIRKTSIMPAARSYLRAALTYCAEIDNFEALTGLIVFIRNAVHAADTGDGMEYLQFFKDLYDLPTNNIDLDPDQWHRLIAKAIPYWAPTLLSSYDPIVRSDTEDHLQATILRYEPVLTSSATEAEQENQSRAIEQARSLGIACLQHLEIVHVEPRQSISKSQLLTMQAIINACKAYFDFPSSDPTDNKFMNLYNSKSSAFVVLLASRLLILSRHTSTTPPSYRG